MILPFFMPMPFFGGSSNHNHTTVIQNDDHALRESNQLKREEIKLNKEKIEFDKFKEYLNSIDINIDRDCLEQDIFDTQYERECFEKLMKLSEKFQDGRWAQERICAAFNSLMVKVNNGSASEEEKDMFNSGRKFHLNEKINFGKKLGRTHDRYDYIMKLKLGPSYKPKYITQEELDKILNDNKYGFAKDFIF